jgi:hypothetical protein
LQNLITEQVAIFLEVISFFCVTTDLYGKKRLDKLEEKLRSTINRTEQQKDPQILVEIVGWVSLAVFLYFMQGQFVETYFSLKDEVVSDFSVATIITLILTVFILVIIICGIAFLWMLVTGVSFKLVRVLALYMVNYLIRAVSFEGLLLAIGTILFLLSKFVSWSLVAKHLL